MIKNCTICTQPFESIYGREVCSEECFMERKRRHDQNSNKRRYTKTSNQKYHKVCPVCNTVFMGLRNKYCCKECAKLARKKQQQANFKNWYAKNRRHHIERIRNNKAIKKGSKLA